MELTVDRIEGNVVVCENSDREIIELDIAKFETKPSDGDIVRLNENDMYVIDVDATKTRRESIAKRFNSLFK